MDLIDDQDDLYEESEPELPESGLRIEEQDLRILKAIVSDDAVAREFIANYDHNLFVGNAKPFAKKVIDYYIGYHTLPTRRVMTEIAGADVSLKTEIEFVWDELDRVEYNASEFRWDLDKIKDRYANHKLATIREGISNLNNGASLDEQLLSIRANLDAAEKIRKGREASYTQKTLREYMPEFRAEFVRKSKDPSVGRGLMTGYSYIDYITNGLSPADMLIIGGETGAGKSMFLNNMAIQMWLQGTELDLNVKGANIQYFSLEMPYDQCVRRTMARLSGISTYALRDCQITDEQQLKDLAKAANFINKFPYEFEVVDIPRGVTIRTIEDRYLEAVANGKKPDIVVIDYLGLMETEEHLGIDDWLKLGYIAGQLHEFSRTYKVIVLTAVQLNRPQGKKQEEIIGLHRIGRSSLIMHHATIGVQIETRVDEETFDDMPYHVIKNRNGERGKHFLKKNFRSATVIDLKSYVPVQNDGVVDYSNKISAMEDISAHLNDYGWD